MSLPVPACDASAYESRPFVDGRKVLCNGQVTPWEGEVQEVYAPIYKEAASTDKVLIGYQARMTEKESLAALDAAVASWSHGRGSWALSSPAHRIAKIEELTVELKTLREQIVKVLMWEICKTSADAAKEFDRTMEYVKDTIAAYKLMLAQENTFNQTGGVIAQVRRSPVGVMLNLGPYNYPFNETYCTLIPALLMGNSVVMKLPNVGCLAHICTMEVYAKLFPPGVVNFVSGSGAKTLPPIMETGKVDILAFIGSSGASDKLIMNHPKPHKLRMCLSLDAKNLAVLMPTANIDLAVSECVTGGLSYNGQRCTALKLFMVHKSIAPEFVTKFAAAVDALKAGLPWESGVKLTPLPEPTKPAYLRELVEDAVSQGAEVVNALGKLEHGQLVGPSVLFPVTSTMRVWNEEQFGPVCPIATFESVDEIYSYLDETTFGQQASVFGTDVSEMAPLLDVLANNVSRVNLNMQCSRGPDVLPFAGRKSSAQGTLSVSEALKVVSVETLTAAKDNTAGKADMLCLAANAGCNSVSTVV